MLATIGQDAPAAEFLDVHRRCSAGARHDSIWRRPLARWLLRNIRMSASAGQGGGRDWHEGNSQIELADSTADSTSSTAMSLHTIQTPNAIDEREDQLPAKRSRHSFGLIRKHS